MKTLLLNNLVIVSRHRLKKIYEAILLLAEIIYLFKQFTVTQIRTRWQANTN